MPFLSNTYDRATALHSGAAAKDTYGTIGASPVIVDIGPAFAQMIFNASILGADVAAGNGLEVTLRGSNDKSFATYTNIATFKVGNATAMTLAGDVAKGDFKTAITNTADGRTPLRYLRVFFKGVGSGAATGAEVYLTASAL